MSVSRAEFTALIATAGREGADALDLPNGPLWHLIDAIEAVNAGGFKAGAVAAIPADLTDLHGAAESLLAYVEGMSPAAVHEQQHFIRGAADALKTLARKRRMMLRRTTPTPDPDAPDYFAQAEARDAAMAPFGAAEALADRLTTLSRKGDAGAGIDGVETVYTEVTAAGEAVVGGTAALLKALTDSVKLTGEELDAYKAKRRAEYDAIAAASRARIEELRTIVFAKSSERYAEDEYKAALSEWMAAQEAGAKQTNAEWKAMWADIRAVESGMTPEAEQIAAALIDKLKVASPISDADAKAWADAQEITETAANRLKRNGYKLDRVRADMAEFHKLTGGRLTGITIDSKGDRRANASGIHSASGGTVNIDSDFDKKVLWHELGHHLEKDPAILNASRAMLIKRRTSDTPVSLRKLTGNKKFDAPEVAYVDGWFSAYVGKVYPDATEVMSMGVESFSSPRLLAERMAQDPETFKVVAGALNAKPNDLMVMAERMNAESGDLSDKLDAMDVAAYEKTIADFAATVQFGTIGEYVADTQTIRARLAYDKSTLGDAIGMVNGRAFYYAQNAKFTVGTKRRAKQAIVIHDTSVGSGYIRYEVVPVDELDNAKVACELGTYLAWWFNSARTGKALAEYRAKAVTDYITTRNMMSRQSIIRETA